MHLKRGDHVCSVYSTPTELTEQVAAFVAEGLRNRERCWYVGTGDEMNSVSAALLKLGVNVDAATRRNALKLIARDGAYVVHGRFDPETTMQIFNDAIEQAYTDGFAGFRAAAEMSWALDCEDGPHQVILYEALLKSLFANCRAIGLCLYDRQRMPLDVINGVLATHPVARSGSDYAPNPFYEPETKRLSAVSDGAVLEKLARLDQSRSNYPES